MKHIRDLAGKLRNRSLSKRRQDDLDETAASYLERLMAEISALRSYNADADRRLYALISSARELEAERNRLARQVKDLTRRADSAERNWRHTRARLVRLEGCLRSDIIGWRNRKTGPEETPTDFMERMARTVLEH